MERICASSIESAYGRKKVLTGVNLSAGAGQCIGIVGGNGCGKSTLLNILAGLRRADKGTIAFEGEPAQGRKKDELFRNYTGYVPQENNLIEELSVRDNLVLWYERWDVLERELSEGFLGLLGLSQICGTKVEKLSGGMKKRVSIGCALAGHPPVLLLDEPGSSLDLPSKAQVRKYLTLFKEMGGTIVLATHEESELDLCDKIYALVDGKSREIETSLRGESLMVELHNLSE